MAKKILVVLSADPEGLGDQLESWSIQHVSHMIEMPGIASAQAFRLDPASTPRYEPTLQTRPPYMNLCVYELDDEFRVQPLGDHQSAPEPPGGLGPNRPDGYIFTAVSPRHVAGSEDA